MEIKPNRSLTYQFTVDLYSLNDMQLVTELRELVSHHNTRGPEMRRVALNGRLGKNNPSAQKYRGKGHGSYQRILLSDARYADVYVWKRFR